MPNSRKQRPFCIVCGKETARVGYKYCSNVCQQEYQYQKFIESWQNKKVSAIRNIGVVSRYIKKFLRRKFNNKCCLCGWSEINPKTGLVPVVADHIDGNWENNNENNLRLLCPNCDSLTSTYTALNKGNGRKNRAKSRRTTVKGRL